MQKGIEKFIHITCNAGPASLDLPRIFLVRFVLPLYLKVHRMLTVLLSRLTLLEGKYQMLAVPFVMKVFTSTTAIVNPHDIYCSILSLLILPLSVLPV